MTTMTNAGTQQGTGLGFMRRHAPGGHRAPRSQEMVLVRACAVANRFFGTTIHPGDVRIVHRDSDLDQLCVMPPGVTLAQLIAICRRRQLFVGVEGFPSGGLLDQLVTVDEPRPAEPYAFWTSSEAESGWDLSNKSAQDIAGIGVQTLNVVEHLFSSAQRIESGAIPYDKEKTTLCAGSRCDGKGVPTLRYSRLHVAPLIGFVDPAHKAIDLCARPVLIATSH